MIEPSHQALLAALDATSGIVCAVGAGGKKTTLYRLLAAHPGRVALTATAFINDFPQGLAAATVIGDDAELLAKVPATAGSPVVYARPSDKPGRLAGVAPATIAELARRGDFELTLVKADGARMRRIKCPAEHEPELPPGTANVLLILSARALGRPLDDKVAHRPERVATVTGLPAGGLIDPAALAAIYSHPAGLLQGTEGCRVIPVLNMVDSEPLLAAGREVAARTLAACARFDRVVLTSDRRPGYLVEVIRR